MKKFRIWLNESHEYKVPEDKEQQLYDFYMLSILAGSSSRVGEFDTKDKTEYYINDAFNTLVPTLKKNLLSAVFYALFKEFQHIEDKNRADELLNIARKMGGNFEEIMQSFLEKHTYDAAPKEFVMLMGYMFLKAQWAYQFGGTAWARICNAWLKLEEAKDINNMSIWIDHIYDLEHNTGTIFSKVDAYKKDNSYNWLTNALDTKLNMHDPHELIDKISPGLRKMALRSIKNQTGKSQEDYLKAKLKNPPDNLTDLNKTTIKYYYESFEGSNELRWARIIVAFFLSLYKENGKPLIAWLMNQMRLPLTNIDQIEKDCDKELQLVNFYSNLKLADYETIKKSPIEQLVKVYQNLGKVKVYLSTETRNIFDEQVLKNPNLAMNLLTNRVGWAKLPLVHLLSHMTIEVILRQSSSISSTE